jgi:hypothetical protein
VLASDAATWGQPEDSTVVLFVTLTYPGQDSREFIPNDGRKAHRQQRRFLGAWTQQFGTCRAVWKLEFQARAGDWANDWERCAPHWCCWVEAPANTPISTVREWVSTTWGRIVTHRLPLERGAEAIRLLTNRRAHGKIVVMPELRG